MRGILKGDVDENVYQNRNSSDIVGYLCNKCVFIYFSWLPVKWISYYLKHSQQTVKHGLAKDSLTQSPVTAFALLGIEATGIIHHTVSLSPLGINCMYILASLVQFQFNITILE